MKNILIISYSVSHQTLRAVSSLREGLQGEGIKIFESCIETLNQPKFPWGFWSFFGVFPETVMEVAQPVQLSPAPPKITYDLVFLLTPVWFLSLPRPVSAFLSSQSAAFLRGVPMISLMTCRNMYKRAANRLHHYFAKLEIQLVTEIFLTDPAGSTASSFITTPLWQLTGRKKPVPGLAEAGIADLKFEMLQQDAKAIQQWLKDGGGRADVPAMVATMEESVFNVSAERLAERPFCFFARLICKSSRPNSGFRKALLSVFVGYMLFIIVFILPLRWLAFSVSKFVRHYRLPISRLSCGESESKT